MREYRGTSYRVTSCNMDCHRASTRVLNISCGKVFRYGTIRTLNACWWRRVSHHKAQRGGAAETASHGKSRRPCTILCIPIGPLNPVFRNRPKSRIVLSFWMGCALVKVLDNKAYVAALEISATGRCSLLERLGIYSKSSCFWNYRPRNFGKQQFVFGGRRDKK